MSHLCCFASCNRCNLTICSVITLKLVTTYLADQLSNQRANFFVINYPYQPSSIKKIFWLFFFRTKYLTKVRSIILVYTFYVWIFIAFFLTLKMHSAKAIRVYTSTWYIFPLSKRENFY